MNQLLKQLILKRGETVLATMSACRPADATFWIVCEFLPTEAYAEIVTLIDEASNVPDTDEGHERLEEIYADLHDSGLRLIDPDRQEYFQYWMMLHEPDGKVAIRWMEETPLE